MKKCLFFVILLLSTQAANSQLTMNNSVTAAQMVTNLIGPGVIASNITYTGAASAKATFTCAGACSVGFPAGIALSSGNAAGWGAGAPGPPISTQFNNPGDPQLDALIAPDPSNDAAVLEFDFTLASDSVKFEFIFASEEYNEWVNTQYNDVFAFFISGPGIVGVQNMAIVPSTTIPISINTINNGNSGGVSTGPCSNCQYYVDNVNGGSFIFDGHTVPMMAKAKIQPCQVYHMKIAIADGDDFILDSGVLLKAGSFTSIGPVTVTANGAPIGNNGVYYACTGTTVTLCLTQNPTYNWSTGATTQCIVVDEQNITPNGMYEAIFTGPNGCFGFSQVQVVFQTPTATITPSGSLDLCPGGTVTLTANPGNTYLWSTGATTQAINVGAGTYTVTVSLGPNCSATSAPVTVTVGTPTAQITGVLSLCDGANTTLTANAGLSYLWSTGAVTQAINVTTAGNYTVTVTQVGGCTASVMASVLVNPSPAPTITGTLSFCQGSNTSLDAGLGYSLYAWSSGQITQNLNVTAGGTYTVTVTDVNGCTASTSATVTANPLPVPAITGITDFCAGDDTDLNAGPGYSAYVWNTGQLTQLLNVTTSGTYTVTVTDANNCSASANTTVTVNPLPVPTITGTLSFCQGSNTILTATAGFPVYQWSNSAVTQGITVSTANT